MFDLTELYLAQARAEQSRPAELFDIYLGDQNSDGSWTADADTHYFGTDVQPITFPNLDDASQSYLPARIKRGAFSTSAKLEIESQTSEFDNVDQAWSTFLANVDLRGKRVVVRRVFLDLLTDITHAKILFDGIINKVTDISERSIKIEVKSNMKSLDVQTGVLQQLYCPYVFGGTRCGEDRDATKVTGQEVDSGTTTTIVDATRTEADDYWNEGVIEFTDGDNEGEKRAVRDFIQSSHTLYLDYALPNTPSAGDKYTLYQGCDKSFAICGSRFDNKANFGGFPHIPQEINPQPVEA